MSKKGLPEGSSAEDEVVGGKNGAVGLGHDGPLLCATCMINEFEAIVKHMEDGSE